jgi:ribosomal-protein-alanine N-acetyltransferase
MAPVHALAFDEARWSEKQLAESLALETTQGWGDFEGDKLRGFVLFQVLSEEAEVLTLAVAPVYHRCGVALGLMETALVELKGKEVRLEVADDNDAAQSLYKKLSFEINGIRKSYYRRGEKTLDAILYHLILDTNP